MGKEAAGPRSREVGKDSRQRTVLQREAAATHGDLGTVRRPPGMELRTQNAGPEQTWPGVGGQGQRVGWEVGSDMRNPKAGLHPEGRVCRAWGAWGGGAPGEGVRGLLRLGR